ncbi:MAG: type IX secretion system protein PorQ [Bacteroidota bacterium]
MIKKNWIALVAGLFFSLSSFAQIGGDNTYEFLSLPVSARTTALGGTLISVKDYDAALGFANPALLNPSMHQALTFSTSLHLAGINFGYAGYAHHIDKWNTTVNGGIQYISYGNFTAADLNGQVVGEFKASEFAMAFGGGYQYSETLSFGANVKLLYSSLESYNSFGLASDLAVTYADTSSKFSASLVFRNAGFQISHYTEDTREPLPFDVQAAFSKQLKYLPLRFTVTAHNLHRWDIRYDDPNAEEPTALFGDPTSTESGFSQFVDNFFRHLIFSGELLLGRNEVFQIRFGYNHLRRAELNVDNTRSLAGFSGGFGLKIKRFRIGYGLGMHHLAGGTNHFTISTGLNEFKR